ncbi:MAG: MAPEG family protein [Rhodobacteraceae bacterium]|nr:MAPEG family protein [Paracoccaceae bacterium]
MTPITVTPIYAAAIAILMAVLSTRAGLLRGKHSVALGDGGNAELSLAIRRFGNLSEYAAMAVLLLLLMELRGFATQWLHAFGATLLILRVLHPLALFDRMGAPAWQKVGRFVSAAGTAALLSIGAIVLLVG